MDTEKEGDAVSANVPKEKPTNRSVAQVEIVEPTLPKLKEPRNLQEAAKRLREGEKDLVQIAGRAARRFYENGMIASYVKKKIGHGNLTAWIEEHTLYHPRTIRRYMKYFEACNVAGKLLLGKTDKTKTDTLSLLPPAEMEEGADRPKHQPGESKEWEASECAKALLKRFENLTARRSADERYEVLEGFTDLARDYIASREGSREAVRGGKVGGQ